MTPITLAEARAAAQAEIMRCQQIASERWRLIAPAPLSVDWTLRGRAAGKAWWPAWRIVMNPQLAEMGREAVEQTAAHEYAHLVTFQRSGRVQPHGLEWQSVMAAFGKPALRCHSYDFKPARTVERVPYGCACPGKVFQITARMAQGIERGRHRLCIRCKSRITPRGFTLDPK